ncbi:MAG: pantoate--beta-alanine ligase [Coriobacteriia bacterium]|nr:pantoate--beta-alanine ligase [Coriobacteriia bacterium]
MEGLVLISTDELAGITDIGTLGFVPTMGALHAGHASLIKVSVRQCDVTVVSVFVNPAQFGEGEDLDRYPRTLEADISIAKEAGADYVYAPTIEEVYPHYPALSLAGEELEPGLLARNWEGKLRPGHFEGVVAVVKRLFDLVQPDYAYFGEKDFQQLRVLEDMVARLQLPVEIRPCFTMRDADGIALSSRNRYLSAEEREQARSIPTALMAMRDAFKEGETGTNKLLNLAQDVLDESIQLDYLAIVDELTLEPIERLTEGCDRQARAIFAGRVASTRLIDNLPFNS